MKNWVGKNDKIKNPIDDMRINISPMISKVLSIIINPMLYYRHNHSTY